MAPQITCPGAVAVECISAAAAESGFVHGERQLHPAPVVAFVSDVLGTQRCLAQITRTYRATDACGNQAICADHYRAGSDAAAVTTFPADQIIKQYAESLCLAVAATDNAPDR
jgi:hypothetical protein